MKTKFALSLAALAFATAPAALLAQDDMAGAEVAAEVAAEITAEQSGMYDEWPADRQTAYDAWPSPVQAYYWTLTPMQQQGWWLMTDDQRVKLQAMAPDMRTAAWTGIEKQMVAAGMGKPMPAASTAGTMNASANASARAAPMAAKDYPICSKTIQDSCIQPREAGKNYGNRPLDYWPGQPASSMKKR